MEKLKNGIDWLDEPVSSGAPKAKPGIERKNQ